MLNNLVVKADDFDSFFNEITLVTKNDSNYLNTNSGLINLGTTEKIFIEKDSIFKVFSEFKELIYVVNDNYQHNYKYLNNMCECYNYFYNDYRISYKKRFKDIDYVGIELFKKFNLITQEKFLEYPITYNQKDSIKTIFKAIGSHEMRSMKDPTDYKLSFPQFYLSYAVGNSPYYKKGFLCSNLKKVVMYDNEAMKYIKKYRRVFSLRSSIVLAGYSMIGYSLANDFEPFESKALNIGVLSASLLAATFTVYVSGNKYKLKNIKLAVNTYNSHLY